MIETNVSDFQFNQLGAGGKWIRIASGYTLEAINWFNKYAEIKENGNDIILSYKNCDEPEPEPCLLYTSPSPRDGLLSRMPSSA